MYQGKLRRVVGLGAEIPKSLPTLELYNPNSLDTELVFTSQVEKVQSTFIGTGVNGYVIKVANILMHVDYEDELDTSSARPEVIQGWLEYHLKEAL